MISWDRVSELRQEIGEEDFAEVVGLFLEEVDEVVDRLRQTPDPARFVDDLHFLKGSALNLGFKAMGSICAETELGIGSGNSNVDLSDVFSIYEASKAEFLLTSGVEGI